MSNAVVPYDEEWAQYAQRFVQQAPVSTGQRISIRGGVFAVGQQVLGTEIVVLVLDAIWLNTFYAEKWVEGSKSAPTCYAYGRSEGEMRPHDSMQADLTWFKPQSGFNSDGVPNLCGACPQNVMGSSRTGRGKACQNRERLAMLPAGYFTPRPKSRDTDMHLIDDPAHYASADVVRMELSVTSVREWRKYVQMLGGMREPPFGVITKITLVPDVEKQYVLKFEMVETLAPALRQVVLQRYKAVTSAMAEPFSPPKKD